MTSTVPEETLRVLLVERSEERANLLRRALATAGHRTVGASFSMLGLHEEARRLQPDVIIVDVESADEDTLAHIGLLSEQASRPHIPEIPNIALPGVFTFRDLADAQLLCARRARSHRTVVLGGGLLGLEAARAMCRFNTEVIVIEHLPRLMPRQLDDAASTLLLRHIESMGIRVLLGDAVRSARVEGIDLRGGSHIACDTLIVAAGIRPNMEFARAAGLSVGRGIRVNDQMQTSDARIYVVGECAEHRERIHGLVAPGPHSGSYHIGRD